MRYFNKKALLFCFQELEKEKTKQIISNNNVLLEKEKTKQLELEIEFYKLKNK